MEDYDTKNIKSLVKNLRLGKEHVDFAHTLTNFMLLFVLSHEFSHAVNGHCILLDTDNPLAFLGEIKSHGVISQDKWSLVAEMSADYLSLQHLVSVCNKSPFEVNCISAGTKISCMLASIFMLFSYWFIECCEYSECSLYNKRHLVVDVNKAYDGQHPISTDRIAQLISSLYDPNFTTRFGLQNLGEWTDEAFTLTLEGFPIMCETLAIREVLSHKEKYLDRAYKQKSYLAKTTLSEFREMAHQFRFPKMKTIRWD